MQRMNLALALQIIQVCETKATELNKPCVITVLDNGGNLVAVHRMDGALLCGIPLSQKKAFTAVSFSGSTDQLASMVQPGAPLYGIQHTGDYIVFGGGVPVIKDGNLIGAIGVSGGTPAQDKDIANAGVATIN